MSSRLADRLSTARHRRFVGRDTERQLFKSALAAKDLPFYLLYVFGPGGVGKTTLLNEFAYMSAEAQISTLYLDARNIDPTPDSFLSALQLALGLSPSDPPLQALITQPQRQIILIDTYEKLTALDEWLREHFLPQLPEDILIVIAGRDQLAPAWRADPGWQSLIYTLPLRNFSPPESRDYLTSRAVPPEQHQAILSFTHGHPLALSLVADLFAQGRDIHFQPEAALDVIRILLTHLVQKVPSPAHRAALEASALVHLTTEALLAEMLKMPDVHELFEWLRSLSCIESGLLGLFPHDVARETLVADLRWRNPDWYAELHHRARSYYASRLQQTQGQEQQAVLIDYMFLHRDNPIVRPFFMQFQSQWQESASMVTDTARESDWSTLVKLVGQYEGKESAELARYWFARQPQETLVFRDTKQQPVGFLMMVALHQAKPEEISVDPATQAAWRYLEQYAPLRPGEKATFFRFWMASETYQAVSPIQSLIFINMVRHYLTTPGLAFTFLPCEQADFWGPIFAYANLARLAEADFKVGGRSYGVYGQDWRAIPPLVWLDLLAEKEIATAPQTSSPLHVKAQLVALSHPEFEVAVRNVLRDSRIARLQALQCSPLLWSRLVGERVGMNADESKRVSALQAIIKEAAESLQSSPRQVKLYNALYHTYFQPAPTQEQAAELLDLPFSTFRRHLKAGVTQLTETLWQREIGNLEK